MRETDEEDKEMCDWDIYVKRMSQLCKNYAILKTK